MLLAAPAHAWGPLGHRIVNGKAIDALPGALRQIMRPQPNFTFLEEHSIDPDLCREIDPEEPPRHFIFLDRYGGGPDPYKAIPLSLSAAERKFGKAKVRENGTLPWAIENRFNRLVSAFRSKNATRIWTEAAWLGHYVGDLHVPHRNAAVEGGVDAAPAGPLVRWEATLLDRHVQPEEIDVEPAILFTRRLPELTREWSRESYRLLEAMLTADRQSLRDGEIDYPSFATLVLPTVRQRLSQAAHRVASLWFTAWDRAGRPTKISGLPKQ